MSGINSDTSFSDRLIRPEEFRPDAYAVKSTDKSVGQIAGERFKEPQLHTGLRGFVQAFVQWVKSFTGTKSGTYAVAKAMDNEAEKILDKKVTDFKLPSDVKAEMQRLKNLRANMTLHNKVIGEFNAQGMGIFRVADHGKSVELVNKRLQNLRRYLESLEVREESSEVAVEERKTAPPKPTVNRELVQALLPGKQRIEDSKAAAKAMGLTPKAGGKLMVQLLGLESSKFVDLGKQAMERMVDGLIENGTNPRLLQISEEGLDNFSVVGFAKFIKDNPRLMRGKDMEQALDIYCVNLVADRVNEVRDSYGSHQNVAFDQGAHGAGEVLGRGVCHILTFQWMAQLLEEPRKKIEDATDLPGINPHKVKQVSPEAAELTDHLRGFLEKAERNRPVSQISEVEDSEWEPVSRNAASDMGDWVIDPSVRKWHAAFKLRGGTQLERFRTAANIPSRLLEDKGCEQAVLVERQPWQPVDPRSALDRAWSQKDTLMVANGIVLAGIYQYDESEGYTAGHAVGLQMDPVNNVYRFFDVNSGVYQNFDSFEELRDAFCDYLAIEYPNTHFNDMGIEALVPPTS